MIRRAKVQPGKVALRRTAQAVRCCEPEVRVEVGAAARAVRRGARLNESGTDRVRRTATSYCRSSEDRLWSSDFATVSLIRSVSNPCHSGCNGGSVTGAPCPIAGLDVPRISRHADEGDSSLQVRQFRKITKQTRLSNRSLSDVTANLKDRASQQDQAPVISARTRTSR